MGHLIAEVMDPRSPHFRPGAEVDATETLRSLSQTILDTRESILGFANAVDEVPRIERRLNRETARTSTEIRAMANHLDRIYTSISRAINASGHAE